MRRPHLDGRRPATESPTTCRLPDRCGPASPTPPQEPRIARAKRSVPLGRWYTAGLYERRLQREICESENLPREGRIAEGSAGPPRGSGTAVVDSEGEGRRRHSRTAAIRGRMASPVSRTHTLR